MKYIGLSLSACIADIIAGRKAEDDVVAIISCTNVKSEADWDKLCAQYVKIYWKDDPTKAVLAVRRMRDLGIIIQPRNNDPTYGHYAGNIWMTVPGTVEEHLDIMQGTVEEHLGSANTNA